MIKINLAAILLAGFVGGALAQAPAAKTDAPKTAPSKTAPKPGAQAQADLDKASVALNRLRQDLQKDRNAVVATLMQLTDQEATVFWPLYAEYRAAMKKDVGDRAGDLVTAYALDYGTFTDEQARKMMNEWFAVQKAEADVKTAWYAKFNEKLPSRTSTRFFQIDNRLDMIIQFQLGAELPLLK